jgi:endonuclease-8
LVVPEGDTIYRAAAALRTALLGRCITSFTAPRLVGPSPQVGAAVENVESHGKHLEITFDDGIVLHTHMRMTGSWHLYRHGERWRKRRAQARAIIETDDWIAVCFNAPIVETYRAFDARRHPRAGKLGPDLCRMDADLHECVARMQHYDDPSATIAEVLLDQRVMCGVGNVFRCEVLWATGVHPWAPVGTLPQSACLDLVLTAAGLLRANLNKVQRITAPDVSGGLAVYGRNGQKCARCGDVVRLTRHGEMARLLYWCPGCQVAFEPFPEPDWSDPIARGMDPHPAATMFIKDVLHNRGPLAS